ncbi:MAG: glycosyltransferase family 2 protein [Calditrichaeota bacterium]|nr:glycosyltransferase family 2 protein [Calditrichota bacterium]
MKSSELVSVILPTHNRAGMLERAVQSVLRQDYDNLELLIIADACTDNTDEIIKSIADQRVRYLLLEQNAGGAQTRNVGMDMARGEYIAFLDDDDEWFEAKLSKQVAVLRANPDTAIVSCQYAAFDGQKEKVSRVPEIVLFSDLMYRNYCGSFSFCMTKREFLGDLRINPRLRAMQDWDLWTKILIQTGLKCRVVQEPLARYHLGHNDRLTQNYEAALKSFVVYVRTYWHLMNHEQRCFQLYKLSKRKRKYWTRSFRYFHNLRLSLKALSYYRKGNHNQKLYDYLLICSQLVPVRQLLSTKKRNRNNP